MRQYSIILLILSLVGPLRAEEEALVSIQFRVYPVLNVDTDGILYAPAPDEEMVELEFRGGARSAVTYEYKGPPILNFYRENGTDPSGEKIYRVVGIAEVSEAETLIFFTPAPNRGGNEFEFSLLALDDGPQGLPANHVTFLNFTPVPFACRFMDKDFFIQPGPHPPISVERDLEKDLFIGLAVTNENINQVVLKSRWRFNEGNRHYILLLPPRREGSFRIRAYRVTEFIGDFAEFN